LKFLIIGLIIITRRDDKGMTFAVSYQIK